MTSNWQLPREDLTYVFDRTQTLWGEFRNARIFLTGGTGFIGAWLIESFLLANKRLNLNSSLTVLTRAPENFRNSYPALATHPAIQLVGGDIRDFEYPVGTFKYVIHGATDVVVSTAENCFSQFETIVSGTQRILEFAGQAGTEKFLIISSGAVYGAQPASTALISENDYGAIDPLAVNSAYAEGKRVAEWLTLRYAHKFGFEAKIARCFAFVGPRLPLQSHLAMASFMQSALKGQPIVVRGNRDAVRSYQYAADLGIWLWHILARGKNLEAYNVGTEASVSIAALAEHVAKIAHVTVEFQQGIVRALSADRYIPCTAKARALVGDHNPISLEIALHKTFDWFLANEK
jgi:nucleoside-diphosphate-sugar epimerase